MVSKANHCNITIFCKLCGLPGRARSGYTVQLTVVDTLEDVMARMNALF